MKCVSRRCSKVFPARYGDAIHKRAALRGVGFEVNNQRRIEIYIRGANERLQLSFCDLEEQKPNEILHFCNYDVCSRNSCLTELKPVQNMGRAQLSGNQYLGGQQASPYATNAGPMYRPTNGMQLNGGANSGQSMPRTGWNGLSLGPGDAN